MAPILDIFLPLIVKGLCRGFVDGSFEKKTSLALKVQLKLIFNLCRICGHNCHMHHKYGLNYTFTGGDGWVVGWITWK